MTKITIKSHSRRGKNGKAVRVQSYARRIGKKGFHLLKNRLKSFGNKPGDELKQKMKEMEEPQEEIKKEIKNDNPKLTPKELAERKKQIAEFERANNERKKLGYSWEAYSKYKPNQNKDKQEKAKQSKTTAKSDPVKKKMDFLEKIEDKLAKFVEKHSGRKYKRQL